MFKPCQRCGTTIEVVGARRYCSACAEAVTAEKRRAALLRCDAEKNRERQARYRERHREAIRARFRARHATPEHKAYMERKHSERRFGGLRDAVLQRDGYRCQQCGTPWQEGSRRIIVHHLDGDPTHNAMDNLTTLCRRCHPRVHGPLSEEHRRKIAESNRGKPRTPRKPLSPEHRANIAAAGRGRTHRPESIALMREKARQAWDKLSPEQRAERRKRISEGRRRQ